MLSTESLNSAKSSNIVGADGLTFNFFLFLTRKPMKSLNKSTVNELLHAQVTLGDFKASIFKPDVTERPCL